LDLHYLPAKGDGGIALRFQQGGRTQTREKAQAGEHAPQNYYKTLIRTSRNRSRQVRHDADQIRRILVQTQPFYAAIDFDPDDPLGS
jgi:hypothetical protein